jgi:hypothetical protein
MKPRYAAALRGESFRSYLLACGSPAIGIPNSGMAQAIGRFEIAPRGPTAVIAIGRVSRSADGL